MFFLFTEIALLIVLRFTVFDSLDESCNRQSVDDELSDVDEQPEIALSRGSGSSS